MQRTAPWGECARCYAGSVFPATADRPLDGRGPDRWAVLERVGERDHGDLLTAGTLLLFCPVFLHDQTGRWDVHDLPMLDRTRRNMVQILLAERARPPSDAQSLHHWV